MLEKLIAMDIYSKPRRITVPIIEKKKFILKIVLTPTKI